MSCFASDDLVAYAEPQVVENYPLVTNANQLILAIRQTLLQVAWESLPVAAYAKGYFQGNPHENYGIRFLTKVYTFRSSVTGSGNVNGNVRLGLTTPETIGNLIQAVNLTPEGAGVNYAANTSLGPVSATDVGLDLGYNPAFDQYKVLFTHRYGTDPLSGNSGVVESTLDSGWMFFPSLNYGGYKMTSKQHPWCLPGQVRDSYKAKIRLYLFPSPDDSEQKVRVEAMNESETLALNHEDSPGIIGRDALLLRPNVPLTGFIGTFYTDKPYMAIANSYQIVLFMPGAAVHNPGGEQWLFTSLWACVPQMPPFLQANEGWCNAGIDELFIAFPFYNWRFWSHGESTVSMREATAGIKSKDKTAIRRQVAPMITGPITGGTRFGSISVWAALGNACMYNGDYSDKSLWYPQVSPPSISWPSALSDNRRRKGFLWNSIVLNKAYPADRKMIIGNREWLVLNNSPNEPTRHSLAICIRKLSS
jgi:hypothetical protein